MNSTGRIWNASKSFILLGALALVFSTARSEVGVYYDLAEGDTPRGPYDLSIIDDIDPVPTVWRQLSPLGSNHRVLNPEGEANGDGRPSLLFDTVSRLPIVAWSKHSAQGYDVVVSAFVDGAWTAPVAVAASPADELDPCLVQDPTDGSVHLLYWVADGVPRVMHRVAPADLSSWSAAVQVSQPGDVAVRPSATFHDGKLTVVYESHGTELGSLPRHIVLAEQQTSGFSYQPLAQSWFGDENWPQVHSFQDKLWVDWIDEIGSMSWSERLGPVQWDPVQIESFSGIEERDYHVRGEIQGLVLQ